ncbi:MAG: glycosyltransferase family 4 protein [Fibrobacteraceae bacterium]|nr:glycosyltransferase family 4 protein [Fibrobacteraceae bacterium]
MRIALVNYRFFVAGGPERYMFNIIDLLEKEGHEVIPFSVKHKKNAPTKYEKYFLSPIGCGDEIYFSDVKKSLKDYLKSFGRMVYSFEAKKCFKKFLQETKPDIIYILYFQNKISCSIVDVAYKMGIPVVQRISDYSLLAPCGHLYDSASRCICEKCVKSGLKNALSNRCIYNSKLYSAVKSLALLVQRYRKTSKKVSKYIFPSSFTLKKFIEAGFEESKLIHIPTPFNQNIVNPNITIEYQPFALYVGRIDPDKGIETLLDAFIDTEYPLKIIGFSSTEGYENLMKEKISGKKHRIEFLGRMDFDGIQDVLSKCLFTLVPSEWYDNLPNTLLESYAMSKCVVATDVGSLTENVVDGKTGFLFPYKDSKKLQEKISFLFDSPQVAMEYGANAKRRLDEVYSMDLHTKALCNILESVAQPKN